MSATTQVLLVFKRVFIVIGIAIAFTLGLVGAIYLSLRSSETRVPDIVGKDRTAAENTISDAGLNFRVRATRASAEAKPDTVLIQRPHAGEMVKVGQTVAVDISRASSNGESSTPAPSNTTTTAENKNDNSNTNSADKANDNKPKKKPLTRTRTTMPIPRQIEIRIGTRTGHKWQRECESRGDAAAANANLRANRELAHRATLTHPSSARRRADTLIDASKNPKCNESPSPLNDRNSSIAALGRFCAVGRTD